MSMSRPGRGFPRGTSTPYRGRGSSENWNSSRGRGSFTGRGRFNWFKENPSGFDSRKYSGSSSGERFSSRGRGEDSGYRRTYNRPDGGYSSRDHHRSPESSRKRMRSESFGSHSQASSSRRSHEGSYGSGGDYNSRYNYHDDKNGGYGEDRGRYRDDRRPPSYRDHSREDYSHRKPESMMPPPSRHMSPPRTRGTYRGRVSLRGSRGMTRILQARRNDSLIARKKFSDAYAMRKQAITARVQSDAWRKLKIQKLRRLALTRDAEKTTKEPSEEGEADDDDDEEEEEDADKAGDEELEEGETVDKKEPPKKKLKVEKEEEPEEGEDLDDEEIKEPTGEGGVQITIKHDSDARDVSEDARARLGPIYRRHFIKLVCPHCHHRCVTFKDYTMHLYTGKHVAAMRKLSLQHKQRLVSMRVMQRQEQRLVEEAEEIEGVLAARTNFCHICKLNYRQLKTKHLLSDSHRRMKKFLGPFCRVCRVAFKSPMLFENHLSSLDHIRRKENMERQIQEAGGNASGSEVDSDDKDIDKYMTLDSVGIVDAEEDEAGEEDGETKGKEEKKAEVNPGSEYLRKLEVYYCDLCKIYLPRLDQLDRAISIHCTSRNHLQRYVHIRNDRALRKRAEMIHKEEAEEKAVLVPKTEDANTAEPATNGETAVAAVEAETPPVVAVASDAVASVGDEVAAVVPDKADKPQPPASQTVDEKLWDEVDRDLGDLLDQVLPESKGSSDEEDETDDGRYDRFRYTSRGVGKVAVAGAEAAGGAVMVKAEPDEPAPDVTATAEELEEAALETGTPTEETEAQEAVEEPASF